MSRRRACLVVPAAPAASCESLTAVLPKVTHARTLGFDGKWAIHPVQLDTLRDAFTPTDDEIAGAREVLAALDRAAADGAGAVADGDRMLDEALAPSARRVLARAGAGR
jgi:citrate lyase beta subunit